jgi:hypothetical protein
MKTHFRASIWFYLGSLICILLISCQLSSLSLTSLTSSGKETSLAADVNATLTANAETEAAKVPPNQPVPTNTAIPPEPPTMQPSPTPQPSATLQPSYTERPFVTEIQATDTPGLSNVTVKNNMNVVINLTLNGPIIKTFSVQPHSSFSFQAPPGNYTYAFKASNFIPQEGYLTIPPGEFTWTLGKAK